LLYNGIKSFGFGKKTSRERYKEIIRRRKEKKIEKKKREKK